MKLLSWQNSGQKAITVVLLILFVAIIPLMAQTPVTKSTTIEQYNGQSYYLHTVLPKQTLYSIAKAYNVDLQTVININPDAKNGLRISQVLRIPTGVNVQPVKTPAPRQAAPTPTASSGEIDYANDYETIYHVAKQDDRFSYIADIYLVSEYNIRLANPTIKEPIEEGEYVLVPIAPKENRPPVTTQDRFQRTKFDPFTNPAPKKSTPAVSIAETPVSTTPEMISQFDNSNAQQQTPTMVEAFSVPKNTQPQTADMGTSSTPEKAQIGAQHIVKPGETLYSISKQHGLSTELLIGLNPGIANGVRAGQVLLLPEQTIEKQSPTPQNEPQSDSLYIHVVEKGHTLYCISRNYATSIVRLKQLNPGLTTDLRIGQQIVVPKKKIIRPYLIHQVEEETRTKRLSRNFDVDYDEIIRLNPTIGRKVYPGQLVKIPLAPGLEPSPLQPEIIETPLEVSDEIVDDTIEDQEVFELGDCITGLYHNNKTFKVALMIPLYLEEYENLRWDMQSSEYNLLTQKPFSFLSFYEGFLIAADSIAKTQGLKLDIKVYDVDLNMGKVYDVVNDTDLQDMDLIIGPFFNKAFEVVAPLALRYKIPIVNPFTQREETTQENPVIIKIKPGMTAQYDQLADLITARYPNANIYIYRAHAYKHQTEAEALRLKLQERIAPMVPVSAATISRVAKARSKRMELQNDLVPLIRIENREFYPSELANRPFDSIYFDNTIHNFVYVNDSVREFRKSASVVRENLVIVFSDDNVFATEFVNKMNQVADTFSLTLVGLPEWEQFDQLFVENLMKMKTIYFSPSLINYEDYFTQLFIKQYRDRFGAEPDRFAFEGFDIGWYFSQAFLNLGKNPLPCLPTFQVPLLQSQYFFERSNSSNGLENKYWNIYQFNRYQKMSLPNTHFIKGSY